MTVLISLMEIEKIEALVFQIARPNRVLVTQIARPNAEWSKGLFDNG